MDKFVDDLEGIAAFMMRWQTAMPSFAFSFFFSLPMPEKYNRTDRYVKPGGDDMSWIISKRGINDADWRIFCGKSV